MTRDYTTGIIQNLRTRAATPQLADCYRRIDGDFSLLWVYEIGRLETGVVMVSMQAESGWPRACVPLCDLLERYERVLQS